MSHFGVFLVPPPFFLSKIRVGLTDMEMKSQCGGGALLLGMALFLNFIFGGTWSLVLHGLSSRRGVQGLLWSCSARLLTVVAALVAERALGQVGRSSCASLALRHRRSCFVACGILPGQGLHVPWEAWILYH